jgi:asparagine synthetase A
MKFVHIFYSSEHGQYILECAHNSLDEAYDRAWVDFKASLARGYREDEVPDVDLAEVVQNHIDEWDWEHIITHQKGYAI